MFSGESGFSSRLAQWPGGHAPDTSPGADVTGYNGTGRAKSVILDTYPGDHGDLRGEPHIIPDADGPGGEIPLGQRMVAIVQMVMVSHRNVISNLSAVANGNVFTRRQDAPRPDKRPAYRQDRILRNLDCDGARQVRPGKLQHAAFGDHDPAVRANACVKPGVDTAAEPGPQDQDSYGRQHRIQRYVTNLHELPSPGTGLSAVNTERAGNPTVRPGRPKPGTDLA